MNDTQVVGYLHIIVENIKIEKATSPIHAHITFGQVAKVDTQPKLSGEVVNQVFMIQVPANPPRFVMTFMEGQKEIAECRYDIHPFIDRVGITHTFLSDLFNQENQKAGQAKLNITYYSNKNGKLKIRIFHLEFQPQIVQKFKQVKVKVTCGVNAQSTPICPLSKPFDEAVQVLCLKPNGNLNFEVVHEKGLLASYQIKNIQQAGILCPETKAYQVSVFNNGNPLGLIKYQVDWIK